MKYVRLYHIGTLIASPLLARSARWGLPNVRHVYILKMPSPQCWFQKLSTVAWSKWRRRSWSMAAPQKINKTKSFLGITSFSSVSIVSYIEIRQQTNLILMISAINPTVNCLEILFNVALSAPSPAQTLNTFDVCKASLFTEHCDVTKVAAHSVECQHRHVTNK